MRNMIINMIDIALFMLQDSEESSPDLDKVWELLEHARTLLAA